MVLQARKDVFPVGFEGRAELQLRVAVSRRDVKVVYALLDRLGDDLVGVVLLGPHHDDAAHPDYRKRGSGLGRRDAGQAWAYCLSCLSCPPLRARRGMLLARPPIAAAPPTPMAPFRKSRRFIGLAPSRQAAQTRPGTGKPPCHGATWPLSTYSRPSVGSVADFSLLLPPGSAGQSDRNCRASCQIGPPQIGRRRVRSRFLR